MPSQPNRLLIPSVLLALTTFSGSDMVMWACGVLLAIAPILSPWFAAPIPRGRTLLVDGTGPEDQVARTARIVGPGPGTALVLPGDGAFAARGDSGDGEGMASSRVNARVTVTNKAPTVPARTRLRPGSGDPPAQSGDAPPNPIGGETQLAS